MPNPEKSRIQRSFVVRASGLSLHVSHNPKSLTLLKVRSTTVHPCLRAENLSSRTLFFPSWIGKKIIDAVLRKQSRPSKSAIPHILISTTSRLHDTHLKINL